MSQLSISGVTMSVGWAEGFDVAGHEDGVAVDAALHVEHADVAPDGGARRAAVSRAKGSSSLRM